MNTFYDLLNDPLKLVPTIGAIGVFVLLALGRVNVSDGLALLAAVQAVHGAISAIHNTPASEK